MSDPDTTIILNSPDPVVLAIEETYTEIVLALERAEYGVRALTWLPGSTMSGICEGLRMSQAIVKRMAEEMQ